MHAVTSLPEVGQIVYVRQRRHLVERIVPPVNPIDSTLVALSCVDDDAQGQQLEVLWDRELDAEILSGEAWDAIAKRGFDPARPFRGLPEYAPVELRYLYRSEATSIALSRRHSFGCLPA